MSLFDSLSRIAEQIQSQRHLMRNEEATLQVSIRPFIETLGYNTRNLAEVAPQFTADPRPSGTDRVDYAILRDGNPVILIEAKPSTTNLTENNWKQLHDYFNAEEVRFGILTNGIEYRFYTDLEKRNIMDKEPFLTIDMLNLDERLVAELDSFTKANFDPRRILDAAQKRRIARLLAREMDKPSDDFVKHFAKQVHSGRLTGEDVQRYRQLVREAWRGLVSEARIDPPPPPPPPPPPDGFIPIYGYRDGHRFKAELSLDSVRRGIFIASKAVRYKGELMRASDAVWNAIRSVDESFDSETWNKEKINSWRFWHVVDPFDGSEREIRLVAGWKHNRDEALYRRILSN